MKKYIKFVFFIFLFSSVFSSEQLDIALSTKNPLIPIYLSKVVNNANELNSEYLKKIYDVLFFDINNNGYFYILPSANSKDILLSKEKEVSFDKNIWKDQKIFYVVKLNVKNNKLFTYVFSVKNNDIKKYELTLTNDLKSDRIKIHNLSDQILFDTVKKQGIASLHILYTVRYKNPDVAAGKKFLSEVWMSDYDGENARQLTYKNDYCVHPIFIPTKKDECYNFLFVSYEKGQPKIFGTTLYSNKDFPVVSLRGNQLLPAISLNADKLAFISDAAGRPDLFLQKFSSKGESIGKPVQVFSAPRATQSSPSFSPDGKKLTFVSDKDGSCRIYFINIDKSFSDMKRPAAYLITKKNRENVTPSWSPDGTKLAYSAKTDGIRQIWIYDFETDEEWQLTKGPKNKENPNWAPDSLHIIYNTEDKINSELYIVNINQLEPVQITKGIVQKRFPSWEMCKLQ